MTTNVAAIAYDVWCADITYIPMRRGFLCLVAIMDWYSRKVLAWRLSNSMDADFCIEALKEALATHGTPEIFNSDQGSQFTSGAWIDVLTDAKIKISMDGKGAWRDNRMIERLWRSLKYECVYLNAFETGSEMRTGIGFVAQIGLRVSFPFSQTDLAYCLCDRYAKSGVAVEDGDADLDFRGLSFEVPRHERLAQ
jgi:transposase InsO family protein